MKHSLARHVSMFLIAAMIIIALGTAAPASPAYAAVGIVVNTTADELNSDGDCSLREAIQAANFDSAVDACSAGSGDDTITVPAGTYTLTIAGMSENGNATGDLDLTSNITINGAGATSTIIQAGTIGYPNPSANGIDGVFDITGNHFVTLNGITIANAKNRSGITTSAFAGAATLTVTNSIISGNAGSNGGGFSNFGASTATFNNTTFSNNSASSLGGGIYTQYGAITITNSTFLNNSAHEGGGVAAYASATIANSTFSGNTGNQDGGAIMIGNTSTVTIANSTIAGNTAGTLNWSGGVYINSSTLHLNNTIIANNTAAGAPGDCRKNSGSETVDGTNNLIEAQGLSPFDCGSGTTNLISGTDPNLDVLTGSPAYFQLVSNSPAINAGSDAVCAAAPVNNTSQNGATRPVGAHCEIGSYEGVGVSAPVVDLNPQSLSFGLHEVGTTSYALTVTVTNTGSANLNIGTLGISGDFNLSANTCDSASLASNGTCTFDVTFSPTAAGVRTGSVSIPSNAASSPDTVNLNGSGYELQTSTFTSIGSYDGTITESGQNTGIGRSANALSSTFMVGDDRLNRQIVSILHFNTASLPDNAVIMAITLRIKQQSGMGTNPFLTHGPLYVDFGTPFFGAEVALKPADFQAYPSMNYQGPFNSTPLVGNWYEALLSDPTHLSQTATTQFRLHFNLNNNNDNGADLLRFFSGNYLNSAYRPVLIVEYFVP